MIRQAPLVLTFCSDLHRTRRWLEVREAKQSFDDLLGFFKGLIDAIIAAQNICVAAEARGLGICYMGTTLWAAEDISKLLELPENVFPVTSLVLGHPDEKVAARPRLDLSSVLHREKYQAWTDERINALYEDYEVLAWKRIHSFPGMTEKLNELNISSVADFYTSEIKYGKKLHHETSEMLKKLLIKKKFF